MMQYHFAFDEIITFYIFDYDTNSHINEIKYEMNENNSFIHFFFGQFLSRLSTNFTDNPCISSIFLIQHSSVYENTAVRK